MGHLFSLFTNHTIKIRLQLWISGIILVLAFSIIIPFYFIEKGNRIEEAGVQLKQVIDVQGLYIESWNQEKLDTIKRFALSDNAKFHRIGDLKREFQDYAKVKSEFYSITYVEPDGYIRTNSTQTYVGDREYYARGKEKKSFVSGVVMSKENDTPMITYSSPVLGDHGEFKGIVLGVVTLEMLNTLMSRLSFGDTGEVYVLDGYGNMVTASKRMENYLHPQGVTPEIYQLALVNRKADRAYIGFRGESVYGQYRWSQEKNWLVVGEITKKEIFQKLNELSVTIIVISLIALLLSVAAAVLIASKIERPIRYLLRATKVIQKGNYDYQINADKIKHAPVELRQLVVTFNLMSDRLKSYISLLEHSAWMDQLTEVHNRRYMMLEGNKQLQSCIYSGQTCSVLMMDIDHFKKINDTYGHLVGDGVLHHVASVLKRYAGEDAIVARYGGEEFILLLLRKDAQESAAVAEEVREVLKEEPYRKESLTVKITASIGVAEYSPTLEYGTMVLEDMVSRADHALYRAKASGRNRVVVDNKRLYEEDDHV
ncbi:diguanylate cyclase [Paenibacillus qinlingensis]|uniref:Diguanylate cyclase (GGDEF)-like protein n=1 Tax=Paenibacillus qinlingensis TaxID=1837343 RepID=A0ABU1NX26_9BACL|nr:diguanylate cyclase [Paenibacillus qinlingensis]MDR6551990.1 diguanylate cyclase (GGDEF)-like protein [Paenibacillus qinlingensis]